MHGLPLLLSPSFKPIGRFSHLKSHLSYLLHINYSSLSSSILSRFFGFSKKRINDQPYQRRRQNLHQTSGLIAKDLRQSEKNRAEIRIDSKERRK